MTTKGTKQVRHTRTSKKGKLFPAGQGVGKKKKSIKHFIKKLKAYTGALLGQEEEEMWLKQGINQRVLDRMATDYEREAKLAREMGEDPERIIKKEREAKSWRDKQIEAKKKVDFLEAKWYK